jgi:hypothetical protein
MGDASYGLDTPRRQCHYLNLPRSTIGHILYWTFYFQALCPITCLAAVILLVTWEAGSIDGVAGE